MARAFFPIFAVLLIFLQLSYAQQQQQQFRRPPAQAYSTSTTTEPYKKVYEVRHEIAPNQGDGSYKYYAEYSDGLRQEQEGFVNRPNPSAVKEGSYTTYDENGNVVEINYIADKHGFQPANLPQPPQESEEHIRAREEILRKQQEIRQEHLGHLRAGYQAAAGK